MESNIISEPSIIGGSSNRGAIIDFKNEMLKEVQIDLKEIKQTGYKKKNEVEYNGLQLTVKSVDHNGHLILTKAEAYSVYKVIRSFFKEYPGKKSELKIK